MVATDGIESAIRLSGGLGALFPKALTQPALRSSTLSISYELLIHPQNRVTLATHAIDIHHPSHSAAHRAPGGPVTEESLTFRTLRADESDQQQEQSHYSVAIRVKGSDVIEIDIPENVGDDFLEWLGLGFLVQAAKGPNIALNPTDVIRRLVIGPTEEQHRRRTRDSLIAPRSTFTLAAPAQALVQQLSNIRRYDLQLSELRRQQEI
jgi:hypothetical protein